MTITCVTKCDPFILCCRLKKLLITKGRYLIPVGYYAYDSTRFVEHLRFTAAVLLLKSLYHII